MIADYKKSVNDPSRQERSWERLPPHIIEPFDFVGGEDAVVHADVVECAV